MPCVTFRIASLLMLIVNVGVSTVAMAQEEALSLQGSFGLTAASFSERVTGTKGSLGVRLGFTPRLYRVMAAHVEVGADYLGALCFQDDEECETARSRTASSNMFMLSGAVAVGMLTPPVYLGTQSGGVDLALGVFAGQEWVEAGFGQGDCLNCRLTGADLRGGLFVEPTLELWFFSDAGLGVSYRVYSTAADLNRRLTVRFIARSDD